MNGFSPMISRMLVYLLFEMLAGLFLLQFFVLHELGVSSLEPWHAGTMFAVMTLCFIGMIVELGKSIYRHFRPGGDDGLDQTKEQEMRYRI